MVSPQRILVLGTSHGGGNWPPLAAVIDRALGNPHYQEHAARIASRLQAQDAVAMARTRIEALLEST